MKNRYLITTLLLVVISWAGCKKEYLTTPKIDPTIPVSYATEINPIWTSGCIASGCHNTGGIPPVLTADKSYANLYSGGYIDSTITTPANVELYKWLTGTEGRSDMGKEGNVSPAQMEKIKTWIAQGSKNN